MAQERADAARNRSKILAAAAEIVAAQGVRGLAMADVAAASGVGVGTLYRRFGDRSGLAYALIDEKEREFQQAFLAGPPPLGPGAPPAERVRAFLHALTDRTFAQLDLLLMAETAGEFARFGGAYQAYHQHLAMLIGRLGHAADAAFLADALLAPLAANLVIHREREASEVKAGLDALLAGLDREDQAGSPGSPHTQP
ncbi:TetR/AcrR family transcriptional regulator [Nonomuraea soli]|uniref:AcrR family transcriptional regulator n=1 Tax=Nonomuraea soli TaxID=1032476 RepID=A0A7W0HR43_9ACTN|nr:TetR/AcrR family transcriptional regulator [Nonomuraea soli]MBA2892555.1 AcrR family transcriptional regulator [Nonomuraea soli]